ncbi:hypothetical protein EXU57_06080 [Segetibacter sp. 3557_3]|uniref:exosortase/archaeosortase family protein n=1 Tax=Segetibacter sp. 3557_3 TaxID=2547429 RepID=UPI001058ABA7|nr:exosortase/archaeosortase family protein [Segetibacter sp. 3557_3]TDH28029.1 hypothetical protein EXU57_06080 [Segetibacter sp. 3557_3]
MSWLPQNKGFIYIIKFLCWFAVLYGGTIFFIGLTSPAGGFYSSFLDNNLNYINWWRTAILEVSNIFAHLFGMNTFVQHPMKLKAVDGAGVRMVYSCIGYGVTSFWCAFVLANEGKWQKKLFWAIAGGVGLFLVNCLRVSLLLLAVQSRWQVNRFFDHHTLFNIAAYALIFFLMYIYTRNSASDLAAADHLALQKKLSEPGNVSHPER